MTNQGRFWNWEPYKLWEFKQFRSTERIDIISDHGTYLAFREIKKYDVALFYYGGFFVELFVDNVTRNAIRATPLQRKDQLNTYLDLISISDLFI